MEIKNILQSQGLISAVTICLLLSSYIFTIAYNFSAATFGDISSMTRIFMFLTILFLFLFLAGFVISFISVFHLKDAKEILMHPGKISTMSAIVLLCSYLSTIMHSYAGSIFGELAAITQVLFYLSLVFIVFFVAIFLAMLVSFSNKFLYSKKL